MKAPLAKIFQKNKNELFRKLFAHPRSEGKSIHLVWSITLSVDDLLERLFTKIETRTENNKLNK